jgi:hypothetical protein
MGLQMLERQTLVAAVGAIVMAQAVQAVQA